MKPIYLFHGEDSYTSVQKTFHWHKEFEKKYGDLNSQIFEGEDLTAAAFLEAITTLPFLSEKKMVIIRNFFASAPTEELKKVAEKFEHIDENCIVVFVERKKADSRTTLFKNIKKMGQIMEFNLLDKFQLIEWIENEVRRKGGIIQRAQSSQLADSIGPDLWQMKHEIEKLILFANGQPITTESIESLTNPNLSASIFKLTDNISLKKRKESIKTLKTLIDSGENPIQMMFMIVRHFRILIQIKDCLSKNLNSGAITKKIGAHPYAVNIGIKQSQNFDEKKLAQIYQTLLNIDIAIKSGKIRILTNDISELRLALEKFIVQFS